MRLLIFLIATALAQAAGTITQTLAKLGDTSNYVITITWTADASDGTLPSTSLASSGTNLVSTTGFSISSVTTNPGSPSPTANWDLTLTDADGYDLLEGLCANRSATATESCAPTAPHPINGTVTIAISGNSVNSAAGVIAVYLTPTTVAKRGVPTDVTAGATLANAATSDNTANAIVKRNTAGGFNAGSLTLQDTTPTTGSTNVVIQAGAGQSGNLLTVKNSGGTTLASISSSGSADFPVGTAAFTLSSGGAYLRAADTTSGLQLHSQWGLKWGDGLATASPDSSIGRSSAGLLEINNGTAGQYRDLILRELRLTTTTEGTCDSSRRGDIALVEGGAGVADTVRICRKDAADAYAWVSLI